MLSDTALDMGLWMGAGGLLCWKCLQLMHVSLPLCLAAVLCLSCLFVPKCSQLGPETNQRKQSQG